MQKDRHVEIADIPRLRRGPSITWPLIDYNGGRVRGAFSILLPQNKANNGCTKQIVIREWSLEAASRRSP
jgi:hypothetical protein